MGEKNGKLQQTHKKIDKVLQKSNNIFLGDNDSITSSNIIHIHNNSIHKTMDNNNTHGSLYDIISS